MGNCLSCGFGDAATGTQVDGTDCRDAAEPTAEVGVKMAE